MPRKPETQRPVLSLSKTKDLVISRMIKILEEMRKFGMISHEQFNLLRNNNIETIENKTEPYELIDWYHNFFCRCI